MATMPADLVDPEALAEQREQLAARYNDALARLATMPADLVDGGDPEAWLLFKAATALMPAQFAELYRREMEARLAIAVTEYDEAAARLAEQGAKAAAADAALKACKRELRGLGRCSGDKPEAIALQRKRGELEAEKRIAQQAYADLREARGRIESRFQIATRTRVALSKVRADVAAWRAEKAEEGALLEAAARRLLPK